VDGVGNRPGSDADREVALDIQVVGDMLPNCTICVYFAPNTDQGFYDSIHAAIYDKTYAPSIISISCGGPENQWSSNELNAFAELFKIANEKGINICVASGDAGATDGEHDGKLHVDFPASCPWALACGGTTLICPNKIYDSVTKESCWGNSNGAGGGGYSAFFY